MKKNKYDSHFFVFLTTQKLVVAYGSAQRVRGLVGWAPADRQAQNPNPTHHFWRVRGPPRPVLPPPECLLEHTEIPSDWPSTVHWSLHELEDLDFVQEYRLSCRVSSYQVWA